jgi:SAM-dependent methyltransferase
MAGKELLQAPEPNARDRVREVLEGEFYARLVPRLLRASGGGAVLDLGCGDGLAASFAGEALERYVGVDARPVPIAGELVLHDLRGGLGPVGRKSFDLYLGTFGVASHLAPAELRRLVIDVARHATPGSIVALEALGLSSLEWPRLWTTASGSARTIPYRLDERELRVHPWAPFELATIYEQAGIDPVHALDRSVQFGPKIGDGRYWPGLPRTRRALDALLADSASGAARDELGAPLGPLPASAASRIHHALARRRRALTRSTRSSTALARAAWALEPSSGGGYGHGLMLVGRVR